MTQDKPREFKISGVLARKKSSKFVSLSQSKNMYSLPSNGLKFSNANEAASSWACQTEFQYKVISPSFGDVEVFKIAVLEDERRR